MVTDRELPDFPGDFSTRLPNCKPECAHRAPIAGRCNAHTRAGRLCSHGAGQQTDHPGAGRCSLHGGRTPRGAASPHFKHGRHSSYFAQQADAELALYAAVTFVQELAKETYQDLLSARRLAVCEQCGELFARRSGRHRYDSAACRRKANPESPVTVKRRVARWRRVVAAQD